MDNIILTLFRTRKTMSVREIAKDTGLKISQVHNAIYDLTNRNMIIKEKREEKKSDRGPKKPYIKLRDLAYTEKYLDKRGLL